VDFGGGEGVARSDVREAHEGVHQGELARVIEPQSGNALACRSDGRLSEPL
jgi:hypothetical protein